MWHYMLHPCFAHYSGRMTMLQDRMLNTKGTFGKKTQNCQ
jgi:hypothetical protein